MGPNSHLLAQLPAHSPAMRVLCCRACSSSSTCCSREACPWGLESPSSATPSRQPGMDDVLMNLPVSAPPCRRDWRACLSASCCVDSFGEAYGWGGETEMREGLILPQVLPILNQHPSPTTLCPPPNPHSGKGHLISIRALRDKSPSWGHLVPKYLTPEKE